MLGRAPSTIITDDDKAMGKAIAEILPNTTHRLCLWHILQKVPEHLAQYIINIHLFKEISGILFIIQSQLKSLRWNGEKL
jgi:hypothetical protein